ncbi:hypothetical protein K7X08_030577 [Anisodus acutangulus]|uniref:Uncharacterized protein n=1 Tax=Anisodus acutangulus TaxID=402998 RepID=A0A9Q1MR39_9SOLA|nr:hypothetical protein K7X08_030577 [Anisodus acutangulus]
MSNKSPIFPIAEPQHFSDYYGFLDLPLKNAFSWAFSIQKDLTQFFDPQIDYFQSLKEARKHKKPTSRDESSKKIKKQIHRKKWWRNALFFFKWNSNENPNAGDFNSGSFHRRCAVIGGSINGPVYITESRIGSSSSCRKIRRPFTGALIPSKKGDLDIPYINLKEFNMDQQFRITATSATPIYLVT